MADTFRIALRDIARGYSSGVLFSRPVFIKHLSYSDQTDHDTKREQIFNDAKERGLPTNEEKEKMLVDSGLWDLKEQKKIDDSRRTLEGMMEGRSKAKWPSLVQDYTRKIEAEEKILNQLLAKKAGLMGVTCEAVADAEINDFYILSSLFSDANLMIPFLTEEQFDYQTQESMRQIVTTSNRILDPCNDLNMKKLAMQAFFQNLYGLAGDRLTDFFGKPICQLTFYQSSLLQYASRFRAIYLNNDTSKWPKEVLENPDAFIDYAITLEKGKKEQESKGAYDADTINVGVKESDGKALGLKTQNSLGKEIAEKYGGNFTAWAMAQKK